MDFGISGVTPEPRRGYRSSVERDRHLRAFSDAVWQRHEATHAQGGSIDEWPNAATFKQNWPDIAFDLIVANWKHARAAAQIGRREPAIRTARRLNGQVDEIVDQIDVELLDPPRLPERDWHALYAEELARNQQLAYELSFQDHGDGIELVLERAGLKPDERWVLRSWLYGDSVAQIAEDSGARPQTIEIRLQNGLYRLRLLVDSSPRSRGRQRGDVPDRRASKPSRAGRGHVSRAPATGHTHHQEQPASGGSGPAGPARLRAQAPHRAQRSPAPELDGHRAQASQRGFVQALG